MQSSGQRVGGTEKQEGDWGPFFVEGGKHVQSQSSGQVVEGERHVQLGELVW